MRPVRVYGGVSGGGLRLPEAQASRRNLYGPRGVTISEDSLIVCDTGNHRVLFYRDFLTNPSIEADLVIGQPNFDSERPSYPDAQSGLFMPTDAKVVDQRLFIADSWHHRIMIYEINDQGEPNPHPSGVIGQGGFGEVEANRGHSECDATSLYWPFGFAFLDDGFYVADTGNRRVLHWRDWRAAMDEPADVVVGQDAADLREENRGRVGGDSFRWPHGIDGQGELIYLADAGNHRILGFDTPHKDRDADIVVGQSSFIENSEWPYAPQGPDRLRFPYGVSVDGGRLAIADSANNRVLLFDALPIGVGAKADRVIGQMDFESYGENQWRVMSDSTLCWPYAVDLVGDVLAVADTGNNRVVIWLLED
ncbi:NHL repeat-containing protein [Ferrimicrobium sp.]|uniref:NHL repeat-containing protein n=1 Tax=Ferrimicrobium sp. TaxID=2926050 RepID=UPI002619A15D|nr:NHL repeat-containing protein [Ferrimicrobium sp.]